MSKELDKILKDKKMNVDDKVESIKRVINHLAISYQTGNRMNHKQQCPFCYAIFFWENKPLNKCPHCDTTFEMEDDLTIKTINELEQKSWWEKGLIPKKI